MTRIFRLSNLSTRLIQNASLETWSSGVTSAPDGWAIINTGTVSRSEDNVIDGTYSARVQNGSTEADRGIRIDHTTSISIGETYYVSVWVKPTTGTMQLIAWDYGGVANPVTVSSTGTALQKLTVKKTVTTAGIRIGLIARTAAADGYFDLVQIGTGYVEFIEGVQDTTFRITNWRESVADYKGGGDLAGSVVGDNAKLVSAYWDNAIQTVDFHVKGRNSQDNVGAKIRELMNLCYAQANRYGFDNSILDPVYIETKYKNETNPRYALVVKATIPEIPDGMGIEFEQLHLLEASLIVQHKQWLSVPPGHGAALKVGNTESYTDGGEGSVSYGTVNSAGAYTPAKGERSAWVGNHRAANNITHVFNYDASLTSFGSNLIGAALPQTLLPSSAAVGDLIYFGIDTTFTDSGPFTNILFDIGTVASSTVSYGTAWEYYNGSTWAALTAYISDNTTLTDGLSFALTGQRVAAWLAPSDWATVAINSVTGYWVRLRLSALSGTFTNPTQANRTIMTVAWPYLQIDGDQVGGSIQSQTRMKVRNWTGQDSNLRSVDYVFAGLRGINRGSNFTSVINWADEQNPTGITLTAFPGAAFGADINTATGRSLQFTSFSASTWTVIGEISFSSAIANHYYGKFRAFATVRQIGGSANTFRTRLSVGGQFGTSFMYTTNYVTVPVVAQSQTLIDFGEITLPGTDAVTPGDAGSFKIFQEGFCASTTPDLYLERLVLIPSDEMFYAAKNTTDYDLDDNQFYLDADNLSNPKRGLFNAIRDFDDNYLVGAWGRMSTNLGIGNSGTQRLWFCTATLSSSILYAPHYHVLSVELSANKRYLSMRGAG